MKLLHVTVHSEYADAVVEMLEAHGIERYVHYPRMRGRDSDGRHDGSKTFPGDISVLQAEVDEEQVDALFDALSEFRGAKRAHQHLQALVLSVHRSLVNEDEPDSDHE